MRIELITFHIDAPRRYDEILHYSSKHGEQKIKMKDPKDRYKYVEDYVAAENMKVINVTRALSYVTFHLQGD
ncbi:MAG: hypothetical protein ACFE7R_04755 [Candidatus Hodarchaeota archaeon]